MSISQKIASAGQLSAFAKKLNLSRAIFYRWDACGAMPVKYGPQLENLSSGQLTCEELRPDVCWVRVPDASWPHPRGRPLVDYFAIHSKK